MSIVTEPMRKKSARKPHHTSKWDASYGAFLVACGMLLGCAATAWGMHMMLELQHGVIR